jgi:hypothetical protein
VIVRVVACVAAVSGAAPAFFLYGMARTMSETFGFSATSTASSLMFTVFLASPVLLLVVFAGLASRKFDPGVPIVVLAAGLFAGCVASEAWLLIDEARFSSEVAALRPGEFHDRGRAWPFQNAGLVFIPGQGIHATD